MLDELDKIRPFIKEQRYVFNGMAVPRVTEIISKTIHEDYIVKWANSLGFKHKSYVKTLEEAADYGSRTHSGLENLLKNEVVPENTPEYPLEGFKLWWEMINKENNITILGQEKKLVCPWFGGTYDMILDINGRKFLVDFKTSNHLSYKYCLQMAAYNYILEYLGEASIEGIIILQLSKKEIAFNEFVLDFVNNQKHREYFALCERTFLSLVDSYYHILEVERQYKSLGEGM